MVTVVAPPPREDALLYDDGQRDELVKHKRQIKALRQRLDRLEQALRVGPNGELSLVSGSASITLRPNGDIFIRAHDIAIHTTGGFKANASGEVRIRGRNLGEN